MQPSVSIIQKNGVGITKRIIFYVPTTGPDSINRRIRKCKTMPGSKSYYPFMDVGEPGVIEIRERSCHQCPGCRTLTNVGDCVNMSIVGPIERVELAPEAESTARVTRHALQESGKTLASSLIAGSVVVVEVHNWCGHKGVEHNSGGHVCARNGPTYCR